MMSSRQDRKVALRLWQHRYTGDWHWWMKPANASCRITSGRGYPWKSSAKRAGIRTAEKFGIALADDE